MSEENLEKIKKLRQKLNNYIEENKNNRNILNTLRDALEDALTKIEILEHKRGDTSFQDLISSLQGAHKKFEDFEKEYPNGDDQAEKESDGDER